MQITDIRKKSKEELKELVKKTNSEVVDLVRKVMQGKEKNVKKPRQLRKDIARIKSVIREKEVLEEAKSASNSK